MVALFVLKRMFYARKVGCIFVEISIKNPPRIGDFCKRFHQIVANIPKLFTFL